MAHLGTTSNTHGERLPCHLSYVRNTSATDIAWDIYIIFLMTNLNLGHGPPFFVCWKHFNPHCNTSCSLVNDARPLLFRRAQVSTSAFELRSPEFEVTSTEVVRSWAILALNTHPTRSLEEDVYNIMCYIDYIKYKYYTFWTYGQLFFYEFGALLGNIFDEIS